MQKIQIPTLKHSWFRFTGSVLLLGWLAGVAQAQMPVPNGKHTGLTNAPLASWSFRDSVGWTGDGGQTPIAFANLAYSYLGNGASLVVDTNVPAWLNYNLREPSTGATNLVVNGSGSLTFWFAPSWSSVGAGGTGAGQWAQLIEIGEWTTNADVGYWGLAIDPTGENLWFNSQDGAGNSYSLSTPIAWATNYFHFVALTYSPTNVTLYLDGQLATSDSGGLNLWPNAVVLATGVFFGSNPDGLEQAQGLLIEECKSIFT
jgi:hypothetical protein